MGEGLVVIIGLKNYLKVVSAIFYTLSIGQHNSEFPMQAAARRGC